ncbi:hypothetical protein KCMC57_up46940 [Kitasatospora sp. CMC57]|uniref:Uncharacterized protein n=1 Tax=Kitasatospora sp. CMC57 TaxID=3231513 RepID=A0AB33K6E4_9ACTN
MPGQRKRKQREQEARRRHAAAYANARWEVIYETQDYSEWQAYVRRLRAERLYDESSLRIDTLCGRLQHPTTYRLSAAVPADSSEVPGPVHP